MKQINCLALCLVLFLVTQAQVQVTNLKRLNTVNDTLVNTDTTTYSGITPTGSKNVNFVVQTHQVSGTLAGTVKLYGSMDGTYYTQNAIDSLAFTNGATASKALWRLPQATRAWPFYKLQIITSGTVSTWQRSFVYSPF